MFPSVSFPKHILTSTLPVGFRVGMERVVAITVIKVKTIPVKVITWTVPIVTIKIALFSKAEGGSKKLLLLSCWAESSLVVRLVCVPLKGHNPLTEPHVEQFGFVYAESGDTCFNVFHNFLIN
jgi:hypothetical protein